MTDSPRPVTPTTILAQELRELVDAVGTIPGVDDALIARLRRASALAGGLDPYLDSCTSAETDDLTDLTRRTQAMDWTSRTPISGSGPLEKEMLSGHVEGRMLQFFVRMTRATRVLDIGMFTGYSALAMAQALPDGGTVTACEVDPFVTEFARSCFDRSAFGRRIDVEVGPAMDTLHRLNAEGRRFDFVFVDADKTGYLDYYHYLLDSDLLDRDAIVAVDNTLLQGLPYAPASERTRNGDAVAEFNAAVAGDERVEQVLLPVRDGVTLIRRVEERTR